jgi:hypothetical protein
VTPGFIKSNSTSNRPLATSSCPSCQYTVALHIHIGPHYVCAFSEQGENDLNVIGCLFPGAVTSQASGIRW